MELRGRIDISKYLLFAGVAILIFTVAADFLFLSELKNSYADTENIISGIAGSGASGDSLLIWLKESPDDAFLREGEHNMAEYGYDADTLTVWDLKYRAAKAKILIYSAVFDFFLFCVLFFLDRFYKIQNNIRISELEKILRQLQNTEKEAPDVSALELEDVLKDRLSSLAKMIQTDHASLYQEKEDTKSLVTDISHQLKTPVSAMKTSLELLSAEDLSESERAEFLKNCMSRLEGIESLTKSLIQVSRMEKGMIQLHAEVAPIKETIYAAVSRMYEKAGDKHISIEMAEDALPEDFSVLHDRKWTAEVFVNLIDNAIKYSNPHTKITIRLEEITSYLKINVEDEGIGVPKDECHKIFQRFYRGSLAKDSDGSGVGLYLAREILERQSGMIYAHAKRNGTRGSVFSVQLPKSGG